MKKMILQMTAAQLLMQIALTLYSLSGHLIRSAAGDSQTPDFTPVMMLEPALRVQNHCRKRWRHVFACLFFWGLESAAFLWIAMKLTASGLFPLCEAHAADRYQILPIFACFISGALVLIWLLSEWLREKRTARLYGGEDDPAD